jgi:glycosyltransferase involved in cell wall biosynthesis
MRDAHEKLIGYSVNGREASTNGSTAGATSHQGSRRTKVSVCLASFNGARFVRSQLLSILEQLQPADEVIVADDASTDDTVRVIEALGDERIKVFRREQNGGVVAAFEDAFRHASGDVIFLSDQDDCWLPGKVDAVLEQIEAGSDLVVHDATLVAKARRVAPSLFIARRSGPGLLKNLLRNSYVGCCMAFRRAVLEDVLPVPRSRRILHDMWIGMTAEWKGWRIHFLHRPLIRYEIHDANLSARLPLHTAVLNRIAFALAFVRYVTGGRKSGRNERA